MKTYDIINAGSKNRFTVNGRVVSNSGRQIQLQNLVRNELSTLDEARELVKMGAFDLLESIYGNVPDVLSQLCRTMLIPKPGCEFVVADFSAIEARVLAFLAGEEWVLDAFARGEDIYCATASQMFGVPVVKHGENGELRQKGKIATLACGYGGGVGALAAMGALDMGLKEAELEEIISSWREANPDIVRFWWDLERAAIKAVKKQEESSVGKIGVEYYANTLWLVLPSGRKLAYLRPKIETNKFGRTSVTYDGLNAAGKMVRIETYGGKYAENCVAEGTLILTHQGLVPIEKIRSADSIWDGVEWVHHEGVIDKGIKETIELVTSNDRGILMTPDHKILTEEGWCESGKTEGLNWAKVWVPNGFRKIGEQQAWEDSMEMPMRMRKRNHCGSWRLEKRKKQILRMRSEAKALCEAKNTWYEQASSLVGLAQYEATVHRSQSSRISQLRWTGNYCLRTLVAQLREFLGRYGTDLAERIGNRSYRQQQGVQSGKLSMGEAEDKQQKQKDKQNHRFSIWKNDRIRACRKNRYRYNNTALSFKPQLAYRITVRTSRRPKHVYDIRNCGPRHRFAVWDSGAKCLRIVSNCTQTTARDLLAEAMWRMEQAGLDIALHVHDEVVLETPINTVSVEDVCKIMNQNPDWAEGLPLASDGYKGNYYFKS